MKVTSVNLRPASVCTCCGKAVPVAATYCSWRCRNVDDRHDLDDYEIGEE